MTTKLGIYLYFKIILLFFIMPLYDLNIAVHDNYFPLSFHIHDNQKGYERTFTDSN